jgi:hypothetical protein
MVLKRFLIPVATVFCLVIVLMKLQPKHRLPEGCRLVLSADNACDTNMYWWLSNRIMLVYRYDASITNKTPGSFMLHDYVSGIDTPLTALTREFNAAGAEAYEAAISDDNSSLIWRNHRWALEHVDRTSAVHPLYRIVETPLGGETCGEKFTAVPAGSSTGKPTKFAFAMPRRGEVIDVAFNRQGDRVAWVEAYGGKMPNIAGYDIALWDEEVHLWVSNIDGSDRHDLGYSIYPITMACDHGTSSGADPKDIHWLPDGRHVSFECKGNVYLAPEE